MRFDELKRIAKENDYEFYESLEYKTITLARKISEDGFINNHIAINSNTENQVFIENVHCDEKDFKMIKASIEFAETPSDEREGKLDTDLADFELVEVEDENNIDESLL